ncbi:head-to-tail stopper [Mycobacterium phage phiT46-1]|uniref:Head-to-tail stopper n=2 Tax=root TaxID=1 RepID=A0A7T1TTI3_9CAUD|nr:head closure Hc1 [Mycobacterium phage phiT46-1]QPP19643.1 head-to-tail stopper [Mycobacterium phage phiT46-1]
MSMFDPGPDTVTLVKRDPVTDAGAPVVDAWGRPTYTERRIPKGRCSWAEHPAFEDIAGTQVAVVNAVGHLIVDTDTETLTARDAVEFGDRLFEMQGPGVRRVDLDGNPSHVRAEARFCEDVSLGEQVTIIAAGRRGDRGTVEPDGDPVTVIARAVLVGNQRQRFGDTGEVIAAAFTVVLDLDMQIRDNDWLIIRGRECRALVGVQLSQWADRNQLVVLAQSAKGGIG